MIEFLTTNWLWILFVLAMVAMHRHGGCGDHSHSHSHSHSQTREHDSRQQHVGPPSRSFRPTEQSDDTRSVP